jgi:hypothetical protein
MVLLCRPLLNAAQRENFDYHSITLESAFSSLNKPFLLNIKLMGLIIKPRDALIKSVLSEVVFPATFGKICSTNPCILLPAAFSLLGWLLRFACLCFCYPCLI